MRALGAAAAQFNGGVSTVPLCISGEPECLRLRAQRIHCLRLGHMHTLRLFARIAALCMICAFAKSARAATPLIPDKRDGQVLEALLLHLLADPEFDMARVHTNRAVIVLHARTPKKTGFLTPDQMRSDIGRHTLPGDAERDLRRRNSLPGTKPDTYEAVAAFFTNLTFGAGIVVADLTDKMGDRYSYGAFADANPKARGWVEAYLPGYSKDGTRAVVRAGVGPSAHGAMVTALLVKKGDKWAVKWYDIAFYA